MATDPNREPTLGDVYHLVGLVHAEVKLARQETESLQRQFAHEMTTLIRRFDQIDRDLSTLFRQQLGEDEK